MSEFRKGDLVSFKGAHARVEYVQPDGECRVAIGEKSLMVPSRELSLIQRFEEQAIDGVTYFKMPIFSPYWKFGFALGRYTFPGGSHTPIGEMINQFKYHKDDNVGERLAGLTAAVIEKELTVLNGIDYIVPVPPSDLERSFQPVRFLSEAIGKKFNIPVSFNLKKTGLTTSLKNVESKEEKSKILQGAFKVINQSAYQGKRLLVIDDVYTTGATLEEVCRTLKEQGNPAGIYCVVCAKSGFNYA